MQCYFNKKKQSLLTKMSPLDGENMQTQYNVLSYRVDLYFHDYKLSIEIDENGHRDGNIDYKIKRQKAIEQEFGCKFIRIEPVKKDIHIFRTINEIFRHIKQSTKNCLINKISTRILQSEVQSDNTIKSKAIKCIVKKYCLIISIIAWFILYKKQWKPIVSVVREILRTKIQVLEKLNKID